MLRPGRQHSRTARRKRAPDPEGPQTDAGPLAERHFDSGLSLVKPR